MVKFKNLLNSFNIDKSSKLIVSVSAGVDSMVLSDLLLKEQRDIVIVHFNHNTRDSNLNEQRLVEKYAKMNNVPCYVFNLEITNGNFQEEARVQRYENLRKIADKYNTPYIVTAHHLDDLAETILLKLVRGSNLYGYAGIHSIYNEDNYIYIKPLLENSKQEILKYADDYSVEYMDDESNYNDTYSRNRIRHTVIPILKQENPKFLDKVLDYHYMLKDSFDYIRRDSNKLLDDKILNVSKFIKSNKQVRLDALALMLEEYNINFNNNVLSDLDDIVNSSRPNLEYHLNNNYRFIKAYEQAFISKAFHNTGFSVELNEGKNILPNMKSITLLYNDFHIHENSNIICYNNLELPLIARTRKAGDYLYFDYGRKKLKDLFIDKKIPKFLRNSLVVITDQKDTILYVENLYVNKTLKGNKNIVIKRGE